MRRLVKRLHGPTILIEGKMIAYLIDKNGDIIERLEDIPIHLSFEESQRDYWQFPIAPQDQAERMERLAEGNNYRKHYPVIAYEVVTVRLTDIVIPSGSRIRGFVFEERWQHSEILRYMGK